MKRRKDHQEISIIETTKMEVNEEILVAEETLITIEMVGLEEITITMVSKVVHLGTTKKVEAMLAGILKILVKMPGKTHRPKEADGTKMKEHQIRLRLLRAGTMKISKIRKKRIQEVTINGQITMSKKIEINSISEKMKKLLITIVATTGTDGRMHKMNEISVEG